MNRAQKSQLVENLKEDLGNSKFIALAHYSGISDKNLYEIRVNLKSKNCSMKIAKNKLTKIAIKDTHMKEIESHLAGPVVLLYSQDPVELAKIIVESSKNNENFKVVTGFLDNTLIGGDKIESLAKLGSLDEVRASFIGTINAVQSSFVRNLSYNKTSFVSLIKNYSSKKSES